MSFNGITWQGFTDLALTHLAIDRNDVIPTFPTWTFQASPVPTTGYYLSADNPGTITVTTVNVPSTRACYL
ncbi:MAG: hypothetical protein V3T56_02030, partial [Gemmatimonadales bacterium]